MNLHGAEAGTLMLMDFSGGIRMGCTFPRACMRTCVVSATIQVLLFLAMSKAQTAYGCSGAVLEKRSGSDASLTLTITAAGILKDCFGWRQSLVAFVFVVPV
jgi:hypothetical protein